MGYIRKLTERVSHGFNWVAGLGLMAMVSLAVANVLLRNLARVEVSWFPDWLNGLFRSISPIPGTVEMVGFLGVVVTAFALAYTFITGGHVAIYYVVGKAPRRLKAVITALTSFIGAALFALIAWQSVLLAGDLMASGEVSPTRKIPFYPFVWGIALSCIPVAVLLLHDTIKAVRRMVTR
jgi:TRAP-type C4-dicarboxylate transport system permease small subunit